MTEKADVLTLADSALASRVDAPQPLAGWIGHKNPFDFAAAYEPAPDIDRYQCGTPVVLAMAGLDTAVDMLLEADMATVRAKSMALTETFLTQAEARCAGLGLRLDVPRDATVRGSQVCFLHPKAGAIMPRVIQDGIIGDFRLPETMRFGFAPLYVRHVDAWDAAERVAEVAREEIGEQAAPRPS